MIVNFRIYKWYLKSVSIIVMHFKANFSQKPDNFLDEDFEVCPSERFLDPPPPPINFVHDKISNLVFIYYYLGLG